MRSKRKRRRSFPYLLVRSVSPGLWHGYLMLSLLLHSVTVCLPGLMGGWVANSRVSCIHKVVHLFHACLTVRTHVVHVVPSLPTTC